MTSMPCPIIALTLNEWHDLWWMSRQQLCYRLARDGWPVVYSNGPLSSWDRGTQRWDRSSIWGSVEAVSTGGERPVLVDHAPRVLLGRQGWVRWSRYVRSKYSARLAGIARSVDPRPPIALLCGPTYLSLAQGFKPRATVLYVNDQWRRLQGWTKQRDNLLAQSVEAADMIVCVAETMARDLPGDGPMRARILPHGVDAAAIQAARDVPCPEPLAAVPRPRIGYIGRVSKKVDLSIISGVASLRPDWHWAVVGNVGVGFRDDSESEAALDRCRSLPNVHFLGVKPHNEVPAYVSHMDINAICFKTGDDGFWGGTSPTKFWEYLAAGKPVVSTPLETMLPWRHLINIASTPEEWVEAIANSLASFPDQRRDAMQRVAHENSWDHRAAVLSGWLSTLAA